MVNRDESETNYEVTEKAKFVHFDDLLSEYEHALSKLRHLGSVINPSSRLIEYKKELIQFIKRDPPAAESGKCYLFSHALREISEIIDISKVLNSNLNREEQRMVKEIPSGNWLSEDDKNTMARDLQYELWLKYLFITNDIRCEVQEPDLNIRWKGLRFPLAAKRPKNKDSLEGLLRKGLIQLNNYSSGGLIALSLDLLIRDDHVFPILESREKAAEAMNNRFLKHFGCLLSSKGPIHKRLDSNKNAIAFLITGRFPYFIESSGSFGLETRQQLIYSTMDDRSRKLKNIGVKLNSFEKIKIKRVEDVWGQA